MQLALSVMKKEPPKHRAALRSGEVRKHGIRLKLHGQPFQVLSLLLEHPGDLVTREELRQQPAPTRERAGPGLYTPWG